MSLNVYQPKASLMASLRYIIIKKSWIRWCWHLQCDDVCMCSVCTPPTKMVLQSSFVMTMAGLVMGSRLRVTACRADHGSQWDNGHNSRSTSLTSVPAPSQVRCLTLSSLLAVHWCVFSAGVTPSYLIVPPHHIGTGTKHPSLSCRYLLLVFTEIVSDEEFLSQFTFFVMSILINLQLKNNPFPQ